MVEQRVRDQGLGAGCLSSGYCQGFSPQWRCRKVPVARPSWPPGNPCPGPEYNNATMTRAYALLWAFIVLIVLAGTCTSAVAEIEVITPAEVKPGDQGICVTEIEGGRLIEIPVTILGVVGAGQPEGEMVLIRLQDPRFEAVGVAAGMSGSPVTVDGRLLGALAFGWQFATEPIAGVTPFTRMQELADTGADSGFEAGSARPALFELATAHQEGRLAESVLDWLVPAAAGGQQVLPLVMASGGPVFTMAGRGFAADVWQRLGWVTTPGGGGGASDVPAGDLVPGSMIAGVLVRGDASLSAGGTVTAIDGAQVWAFGHPFLGAGDVLMPMARASVVTILPSLANSFKMFNAGEIIGTVRSDRRHGVWGTLGPAPEMLPVDIKAGENSYHFEVLHHRVLTPILTGILVAGAHQTRGRSFGLQSVDLRLEVDFESGESLALDQVFDGADAPSQAAAWTSAVIGYLEASPFASDDIRGIDLTMDSVNGLERASVLDITPERWTVEPGQRLGIRVRFRRPGNPIETVRMEVKIPRELADGRLDLVVADGASWALYDLQARPTRAGTFSDEIRLLGRLRSSKELVAALEVPGGSLVLPGGTVAAPVGMVATLRSGLGSELQTAKYRVVSETTLDAGGPVAAAVRLRLVVKARSGWTGDD
ncbi:MAG: hypothetical protein DRJ61_04935 [Acidobacteria bacterium]|nr:MAG: hypothetical protein DRJ61_04935 [Acidobacteriota bacterium]